MSNEVRFEYPTGATLSALVYKTNDATKRWNGSSIVSINSIAASAWATGALSATEQLTSDSVGTGIYSVNLPGLPADVYSLSIFATATPTPGLARVRFVSGIQWNGSFLLTPVTMSQIRGYTNVYFVGPSGSDSNNGLSIPAAFASLSHACSIGGASDLIILLPGTYSETTAVTINSTVMGAGYLNTGVTNSVASGIAFTFNGVNASALTFISTNAGATCFTVPASTNASLSQLYIASNNISLLAVGGSLYADSCQFLSKATGSNSGLLGVSDQSAGSIFRNCSFNLNGNSQVTTSGKAYSYSGTGSSFIANSFIMSSGCDTANIGVNQSSGTVDLLNTQIISSGTGKIDIVSAGGVTVTNTAFATSTGTVTILPGAELANPTIATDNVQASPTPVATSCAGSSALNQLLNGYAGMAIEFATGANKGLARRISASIFSGGVVSLTFTAFPVAPSTGDTFNILGA